MSWELTKSCGAMLVLSTRRMARRILLGRLRGAEMDPELRCTKEEMLIHIAIL